MEQQLCNPSTPWHPIFLSDEAGVGVGVGLCWGSAVCGRIALRHKRGRCSVRSEGGVEDPSSQLLSKPHAQLSAWQDACLSLPVDAGGLRGLGGRDGGRGGGGIALGGDFIPGSFKVSSLVGDAIPHPTCGLPLLFPIEIPR